MNNMLEMLVGMDKELKKVIASENAKNEAIKKETELLIESMTNEIIEDLKEFRDYRKKLNIKKNNYIVDNVSFYHIKNGENIKEISIVINFIGNNVSIGYTDLNIDYYNVVRCFLLDEEYGICRWDNNSYNAIYEVWNKIKQNLEEQMANAYFEEKMIECNELSKDRNTLEDMLTRTKKSFAL